MMNHRNLAFPLRARACGLPLIAAAAVLVAALLARILAAIPLPFPLCLFREMTGLPCPLCGGVRSLGALGRGEPFSALVMNPLVAAGALMLLAWPVTSLVPGAARALARVRRWCRPGVLVPLVLVHWAYLIYRAVA